MYSYRRFTKWILRTEPPKREPCEITVADFDDTKLKVIVTPDRPEYVTVHISLGAVGERLKVCV